MQANQPEFEDISKDTTIDVDELDVIEEKLIEEVLEEEQHPMRIHGQDLKKNLHRADDEEK